MKLIQVGVLAGLAGSLLAAPQMRQPGLDQLSHKQFQQLFSKSFADQPSPVVKMGAKQHVCSIPLEELKVEHPERFSMRRMPARPPAGSHLLLDPGIVGRNPAPACKNWNPGK